MLRSGVLLAIGGPAAVLTSLVLPTVRASADRLAQPRQSPITAPALTIPDLPGFRPASFQISPIHGPHLHLATMPRQERRDTPPLPGVAPSASEKDGLKPRRMTREGCEAPLSSLVGPEARRMVPGRCMA